MQRTLIIDDRSFSAVEANAESFCSVCDAALNVVSSTNIFYTSLPRNGELLASFMLRVLRPPESDLRSSYICSRCNELFQILEQAQWTVSNIKSEILKVYHSKESERALERRNHLSGGQILNDEIFIQSDEKSGLENDRFHYIDEFAAVDVQANENGIRGDNFHVFSNDFLGIGIDNDKKIQENSIYGSKIDCLKDLNADENHTRSDFADSPNDYCHLNSGIDNCDKELEKSENNRQNDNIEARETLQHENNVRIVAFVDPSNDFCNLNIGINNSDSKIEKTLETHENQVYGSKIDCLKTLETELNENVSRSGDFQDSTTDFPNLNIRIDNADGTIEKNVLNSDQSVYGSKIGCLETLETELNENVSRSGDFQDSPTDFPNLNIRIDNADGRVEKDVLNSDQSVYGSKIDCLKTLETELNENVSRSGDFQDSPTDFPNSNIRIDYADGKIEKNVLNSDQSVYGSKIDCLETLGTELNENVSRSGDFQDSPTDFPNLNIRIDNADGKIEENVLNSDQSVYGTKIDCLKTLGTELNENVSRSVDFQDSPADLPNLNIRIYNADGKLEKNVLNSDQSVYGSKIDCLKTLETELNENVSRSVDFQDSRTDFPNLNIRIDNVDEKIEKNILNSDQSVYDSKIGCFKVEQTIAHPKECEAENNTKNCSRNVEVLISSDLLNNSNDESSESLPKDAKNLQYNIQCKLCPRLFKSARDLRSHFLKHGGSRPYLCRKCSERFADLSVANSHVTEMHSSKKNCITIATEPWNNEIADFSNEDSIILDESENTDKSKNNNKKADCDSAKIGKSSRGPKPLKYPCPTCGKTWRSSAELKIHVKTHSNLKPYMCEKCGRAYKHKQALEIHIGIHDGISPYQCTVCNKCFTQKGALMRHLPMHTGETPYQCELCGKRFVHHSSYNMHVLSHTGKKSYRCLVCGVYLLSTSHLKRHMRVHTGEKPYSCDLCGKSFAERYNLFTHKKIHDPAEIMAKAAKKITYKCEQCDESFDKKQKLQEHTKERHSSTTNEREWLDGNTIDIENPPKTSEIYQTWQNDNYSKLQNVVVGMKSAQTDNNLVQISDESIALLMSQTNMNEIPRENRLES